MTRPEVPIIGTLGIVVSAVIVAELLAAPFARRIVASSAAQQLRTD